MRNLLLLPVAALLVAGCVPDRDNKRDPANTPTALLVIRAIDLPEGESCEVTDAVLNSAEAVAITPRGRCLVLDARNSFDPQGTAVSYAFLLPEEVQTDCNISQTIDSEDRDVVVVPAATQQCIAINEIRTIYVRVRDATGADGHAEASLVLTNSEPVAATRESRSLPVGGSRWAPGAPYDIVFDGGESFDAEGDELEYCWTLPGQTELCNENPVRVLTGVPSNALTRITARLRVTDNRVLRPSDTVLPRGRKLSSFSIPATVAIEQPVLWSAANTTIVRHDVDPPITSSLANVSTATILPASVTQTVDRLLVLGFDDSVRLANRETRTPIGAATVPVANNDLQRLIADPARGRVFGVGQNEVANQPEGPSIVLWEWTVDETAAVPLVETASPVLRVIHGSAGAANFFEATATIQTDGTLWFGAYGGSDLLRLSTSGALQVLDIGDDLNEIALRPASGGEIWVLTSPESDDADNVNRLLVFQTDLVPVREIDLGNVGSGSLIWVDEYTFWLSLPGGISLVDVRLLDGGAALEDAILFTVGSVQNFGRRLVLDDETGTVWLTSFSGAGARIRRSGSARLFPGVNSEIHFVDENGRAWYSDIAASFTLRASYAPDPNLARELLVTPQGIGSDIGAIDPLAGSIWFATSAPTGLIEVADDGTFRRTEHMAVIDGELRGIPSLTALSSIADRRALWAYRAPTNEAYVFDVSTQPPSAKILSAGELDGSVFHAFVPDTSGTPGRLWTLRSATSSIAILDTSGQFTPVFTIPEILNADGVHSARSAFSNRLCLATRTGSLLFVRWISPDGTVVPGQFTPLGLDGDTVVAGIAVGATSGNGGEQCFVATVRNVGSNCSVAGTLSVYGWDSVGSLTRTGGYAPGPGLTGYFPSFVARTADDLRFHMRNCPGGQFQTDEIVFTWNGSGYTVASKPTFATGLVRFE